MILTGELRDHVWPWIKPEDGILLEVKPTVEVRKNLNAPRHERKVKKSTSLKKLKRTLDAREKVLCEIEKVKDVRLMEMAKALRAKGGKTC